MTSTQAVIERWVDQTRNESPRYLRPSSVPIVIGGNRPTMGQYAPIYSYGDHFELGRFVPANDQHDGFWLLNGDNYSVSTSRHQSDLRSAVNRTDAPVLILPFTTLASAGIDRATIVPIEITKDRWEPRTYRTWSDIPGYMGRATDSQDYWLTSGDVIANDNGSYTVVNGRHVLGESVLRAEYSYRQTVPGQPYMSNATATGHFLSGFDAQETTRHYFLAQLPDGAVPVSVNHAFDLLRPAEVIEADPLTVARQGDVFAVPAILTTRELRKLAPGADIAKMGRLLGLSHVATESIVTEDGSTFARGILTHRPTDIDPRTRQIRKPEHRRQPMGDRKTWHLIVKNTVPVDERGDSRAWSQAGNVD